MKKMLFIVIFFISLFKLSAQESKIENTQLRLENDQLIVTYDIVGSKPLEKVSLSVKTSSGAKIDAKALTGDLGETVQAGKGKRIIWDMKKDGFDLQGQELNVKVTAAKLEEIKEIVSNTVTEIQEVFDPEKQNKNRDIVYLKNGLKLKGLLTKRFATESYKFVSIDGNTLTYKANEIEKIKDNNLSKEEITLKNGDLVKGRIKEIYPNDKIKLKSKAGDVYNLNIADIDKITTYRLREKNWMLAAEAGAFSATSCLLGFRFGYFGKWGSYLSAKITDAADDGYAASVGITKRVIDGNFIKQHIYVGAGDGQWNWLYSSRDEHFAQQGIFAELGTSIFIKRCAINLGIMKGLDEFEATCGIGFTF